MLRESPNEHHYQALHLNFNVESNPCFKAAPDDTRLPAVYEIDWVRTWRPAEH